MSDTTLALRRWAGILAAMGLALALRLYHLGQADHWLDELHSMANSAGNRAELEALAHGVWLTHAPRFTELTVESTAAKAWETMRHDGHPPLYFVLLLLWRRLVDDGEFAVRSLSALLSVASILPAALMARELGRARLAPWVALVLAISFAHVRMAQENRPYALSILLVTTATWLLVRMERRHALAGQPPVAPKESAVPAGLREDDARDPAPKCGATRGRPSGTQKTSSTSDTLGGMVRAESEAARGQKQSSTVRGVDDSTTRASKACPWHPLVSWLPALYAFTLWLAMMNHYFAALGLLAHGVYAAVRFRGKLLRHWLVVVGAAGGLWIVTWGDVFMAQRGFIAAQEWLQEDRADHVARSLMRFFDLPVRLLFDHEAFLPTTGKALAGAAMLCGVAVLALRKRLHEATLPALWLLCPMLIFLAIDLLGGRQMLSHLRYTSVAGPGLVILFVVVAAELPKVWRAAMVGTYLITAALTLSLPTPQNPHSREAAALLAANVKPGEPVIYDAVDWPRFWASSMYLTVGYYLPEPLAPVALLREAPSAEWLKELETYPRIHVVSPRVGVDVNPLPQRYERVFKSGYIEGVGWVYGFELRGSNSELRTQNSGWFARADPDLVP